MFKLLPPTFLILPVAWATVWLLALLNGATAILKAYGLSPSTSWAIAVVQVIFTVPFVTQVWRWFWRGPLARWYPDLNGVWDVEVSSNWPRIDAMIQAARGTGPNIDVNSATEAQLPPLLAVNLEATITQRWSRIDIILCPLAGSAGPIKESKADIVEPFKREDGTRGLGYIFEQENIGQGPHDDPRFRGAGWIVQDRKDPNVMTGRMWTDRRWRQGLNTAADLRFVRRTT